jgi:hypothetical protein
LIEENIPQGPDNFTMDKKMVHRVPIPFTHTFFLISKRISLKKRKAPPSTQDVYTEATQLAHIKNPIKPQGTHKNNP